MCTIGGFCQGSKNVIVFVGITSSVSHFYKLNKQVLKLTIAFVKTDRFPLTATCKSSFWSIGEYLFIHKHILAMKQVNGWKESIRVHSYKSLRVIRQDFSPPCVIKFDNVPFTAFIDNNTSTFMPFMWVAVCSLQW